MHLGGIAHEYIDSPGDSLRTNNIACPHNRDRPPRRKPRLRRQNQPANLPANDYAVYSAILDNLGHPQFPEWKDKLDIILVDATTTGVATDGNGWGPGSSTNQAPTQETIKNYNSRVAGGCHLQSRFGGGSHRPSCPKNSPRRILRTSGMAGPGFTRNIPTLRVSGISPRSATAEAA